MRSEPAFDDLVRSEMDKIRKRPKATQLRVGVHIDESNAIAVEAVIRFTEDAFDEHARGLYPGSTSEISDAKKKFRQTIEEMRKEKPEDLSKEPSPKAFPGPR